MTTLALGLWYRDFNKDNDSPLDGASLRAFFSLVPNVRGLQTSLNFLQDHETFLRVDQQLRETSERIQVVQMTEYSNRQMEEFVRSIFPNARVSYDYSVGALL